MVIDGVVGPLQAPEHGLASDGLQGVDEVTPGGLLSRADPAAHEAGLGALLSGVDPEVQMRISGGPARRGDSEECPFGHEIAEAEVLCDLEPLLQVSVPGHETVGMPEVHRVAAAIDDAGELQRRVELPGALVHLAAHVIEDAFPDRHQNAPGRRDDLRAVFVGLAIVEQTDVEAVVSPRGSGVVDERAARIGRVHEPDIIVNVEQAVEISVARADRGVEANRPAQGQITPVAGGSRRGDPQ